MNNEQETIKEETTEKFNGNFEIYSKDLQLALKEKGWEKPMLVQATVAPYLLEQKDVIVQSRTGSGKTAAFLLPLIEKLNNSEKKSQALILTPTRELASQVYTELKTFTGRLNISGTAIYGGSSYKPQFEALKSGVQIVIGTPGRILDHLIRGSLKLDDLKYLVFDEADELLSMGFYKDMVKIGEFINGNATCAMFSATMPDSVRRLASRFMKEPEFLGLSKDGVHVSAMDHIFYTVDAMAKDRILMRIIEIEDPESAIIFCNTKSEVEYLTSFLRRFGYDADQISGDLKQKKRERVMSRLKSGELRFLVATDIAARGIDISNLAYVMIYDMHKDFPQYVHRAGRTARAGKLGVCISLVTSLEAVDLKRFAKKNDIDLIEKAQPTEEQIQARLSEKLIARLEAGLRDSNSVRKERMVRYDKLADEINQHENGKEIIKMLLDGFHQAIIRMNKPTSTQPIKRSSVNQESKGHRHNKRNRRKPQNSKRNK